MAAIADYDDNNRQVKDGRTLVWGRNNKGQLGIGTTDQNAIPQELVALNAKNIRLKEVQCGLTFTIGLTTK